MPNSFRLLALALAAAPLLAQAQAPWPDRPVTVIVPFPAGGGTDLVVRTLQPALARELGQTVIIENRGGAGGTVGSGQAARARPDGYTALAVTTSTHAVSPSLYQHLPYDPLHDFDYVGFIGTSPYVLAVHPSIGARSVAGLIQALKQRGQANFASVGVGTVSHLLGEMFRTKQGLSLTHIPYRGAAPAYTDLIGGQVDLMFDNPVGLASYVLGGKLDAVGTTAATDILPGVATFAEQGFPGYTQQLWYGLAFPGHTPPQIVTRMNQALNAALNDPAIAADLAAKGVRAQPGPSGALAQAVKHDVPFWGGIAKSVGARID
ncbi:tripartite tricarboxylate transporter substrate-binding protein [Bordetella petrii]|uniref:tripartite tricarboxylate transporter substrate-binding protein n=1 Tax=Bordetella petrii TaxID=94624 RepID=UPI001A96E578|nr:tripartite tricarboxylate transporter substrate-binding protein [Bordetella petrii]MBO1114033.1 tripartite tricarboxylate transporter substrate binding protein [Bordetella petrii]